MSTERSVRVNELVKRVLSRIVQREYAHTRLGWITLSRVIVSKDLQHARVFFTVLGNEDDEQAILKRLEAQKSRLRFLLGKNIRLRYIPELIFTVDEELKQAMRLDHIIDDIQTDAGDTPESD